MNSGGTADEEWFRKRGVTVNAEAPAPFVSVILPVYNPGAHLERCLAALRRSDFRDYELIVVDDASTDITPEVLGRQAGVVVVHSEPRRGPYYCRNLGAQRARGVVLVYLDADVEFASDTLGRLVRQVREGGAVAVFGVYSLRHPHRNLCSIYKNAWIRHSYLESPDQVQWFFTAVGAMRKRDWAAVGGFDPGSQNHTGGGEFEIGRRLTRAGVTIRVDKSVEVIHWKRFNLAQLLRNDFWRCYGYTRMALRMDGADGMTVREGGANVSRTFAVSLLVAGLAMGFLMAGLWWGWALWWAAGLMGVWMALNAGFLGYMGRSISWGMALRSVPLMFVDQLAAGCGVAAGLVRHGVDSVVNPTGLCV